MSAETAGALSLLMAMVASVAGFVSIQRYGDTSARLNARLAESAGIDPAHAATKNLYDIMALALEQQTARADAQAKRITELEGHLYRQSDLLRTLQVDRDAMQMLLDDRDGDLVAVREEAARLKERVRELESVAAQVEQMRKERDRAIRTAEEAKAEADALRERVATLEKEMAQLMSERGNGA